MIAKIISVAPEDVKRFTYTDLIGIAACNASILLSLYWTYGLVSLVFQDFPSDTTYVSLLPSVGLAGYFIGLTLLALYPRAILALSIKSQLLVLATSLALASLAQEILHLLLFCFIIGLFCCASQRLVGEAVQRAPKGEGRKAVASLISAALTCLLIFRLSSHYLATVLSWRGLSLLLALVMAFISIVANTQVKSPIISSGLLAGGLREYGGRERSLLITVVIRQFAIFFVYQSAWLALLRQESSLATVFTTISAGLIGIATAVVVRCGSEGSIGGRLAQWLLFPVLLLCIFLATLTTCTTTGLVGFLTVICAFWMVEITTQHGTVTNQALIQSLGGDKGATGGAVVTIAGALGGTLGAAILPSMHQFGGICLTAIQLIR